MWRGVQKYGVTYTKTYLLNLVIRSISDFSQAYSFTDLMPLINSLMVLILSSVRAAVLLLRGKTWEMSHSDHVLTFCGSSSRGHREGPGIDDSLQLFCADITGRYYSKYKWRKRLLGSQQLSLIQRLTQRTCSNSQGRPEVSQIQTICPRRWRLNRKGRKESNRTTVSVM